MFKVGKNILCALVHDIKASVYHRFCTGAGKMGFSKSRHSDEKQVSCVILLEISRKAFYAVIDTRHLLSFRAAVI